MVIAQQRVDTAITLCLRIRHFYHMRDSWVFLVYEADSLTQ